MVEAIISALADEFPNTLRKNKGKLCFAVCLILFLCGLPLVTNVSNIFVLIKNWPWVKLIFFFRKILLVFV